MIIYIAGYGRSGSTILDILIGASSGKCISTGELSYLFDDYSLYNCTCGSSLDKCSVWNRVKFKNNYSNVLRTIEQRKLPFDIFFVPKYNLSSLNEREYKECTDMVFSALSNYDYIIDSSKTAHDTFWRPYSLNYISGVDVKVIHLKRSLISTLRSTLKSSNWKLEGKTKNQAKNYSIIRTVLGWSLANYQAYRMQKILGANNYLYIDYNNLVTKPYEVFLSIGRFVGVDMSEHAKKIEQGCSFPTMHNIGGNRLRLTKKVSLIKR